MGDPDAAAVRRALVGLDLSGPLALQSRQAAAGLRLWAEAAEVDLRVADLEGSTGEVASLYRSWSRSASDIVLLPYGSGTVRAALVGVPEGRLVLNHGGSDDDLARPWAPMVPAPASTYFVPLVTLAAERSCSSLTIVRGTGPFAVTVSRGALVRARELDLSAQVVASAAWEPRRLDTAGALLVVGPFEDDVEVVAGLTERPALLGCVAAGIPAFGEELGHRADGVLGPVQWWPETTVPELGPSGSEFAGRYRRRYGEQASYVAAQAAAGGHLALAVAGQAMTVADVAGWSTSTLLGSFEIDALGRQVGHQVSVVQWREQTMQRVT